MQKYVIIFITIFIYIVIMAVIGILNSKSTNGGVTSFTVGGRDAGGWISALSYGTAYFSAVMFVGYSGNSGWNFGLWSVLIGLGNAVFGSWLAWKVLAERTREVSHRLKIKSMPQLFYQRFNSNAMKKFSAIVIFIFLVPYSASVYKGLTSICSVLLNIDATICMIIIAIVSCVVLVAGGYLATLKADFIQGIVMFAGVALMIFFVLRSPVVMESDGVAGMWNYMKQNGMAPLTTSGTVSLIATVLMTSFGTWGLPQMIHKFYGIKNTQEVKRGTIVSTVFAILVAGGGYFVGSLSHLFFGSDLPNKGVDYIIPEMLNMANLPNVLLGIILVLLIAASVSTLSSITLTACSSLSMDLIKPRFNLGKNSEAKLIRILCLLFVLCSYIVANTNTPILDMMSYSWGIVSGSFLAPYVLSLYFKGLNKTGAWSGMLGGFVIALVPALCKVVLIILNNPTQAQGAIGLLNTLSANGPVFAVSAMLISFILCIAVSKIKNDEEVNQKFYIGTLS